MASPPSGAGCRVSRVQTIASSSGFESSSDGGQARRESLDQDAKGKGKGGKPRWLSSMVGWMSTSEPSLQDWKGYREDQFRRHGVSDKDAKNVACAKLRSPMGELPPDAPSPGGTPIMEKVMKKKKKKEKEQRASIGGLDQFRQSGYGTSKSSVKEPNQVTPWE